MAPWVQSGSQAKKKKSGHFGVCFRDVWDAFFCMMFGTTCKIFVQSRDRLRLYFWSQLLSSLSYYIFCYVLLCFAIGFSEVIQCLLHCVCLANKGIKQVVIKRLTKRLLVKVRRKPWPHSFACFAYVRQLFFIGHATCSRRSF